METMTAVEVYKRDVMPAGVLVNCFAISQFGYCPGLLPRVSSHTATKRVRLFVLDDVSRPNSTSSWRFVDPTFSFNSSQLRSGIVLGLDGRELVTDARVWDGQVTVRFDVTDGPDSASDAVALKLAPALTHHHLQTVETLIGVALNATKPGHRFLQQLDEARASAGIESPLLLLRRPDDLWPQDFMEPAYTSMPGPQGPIALRVILRSAQSVRAGGRQVFEQLRGPGVGGFQPSNGAGSGFGYRHINSYGNLETIPPYSSRRDVEYKAGRIVMGKHFDDMPARPMLETGWLVVGHVDEVVQFLPYDNHLGFTIGVADTRSALKLLCEIDKSGHGGVRAISYPVRSINDPGINMTVLDLLSNRTFLEANAYAQRYIDANLASLLAEVALPPGQVVHVPILFRDAGFIYRPGRDGTPPRRDPPPKGERQVKSFSPEALNGVVVGRHYLSPKTYGPVVDGVDLLAQAVDAAYARAGIKVLYIDDFETYHLAVGEVHCATNTLRQTDLVWWEGGRDAEGAAHAS